MKEGGRQIIKKLTKENVGKYINWVILGAIGIFSCLYSLFWGNFSELHIQFPFLDFPIFVGEILLIFCILMFWMKYRVSTISLNRWHFILFIYIAFVLAKALYGYWNWGPLAFRNAALLYYVLFAIIGYYSYKADLLKNKFVQRIALFVLLGTVFMRAGYKTFYFTYVMLIVLLFFAVIKSKVWRGVFIALFVIICQHNILITFHGGRNILVSSFFAYLFLLIIIICYFIHTKLRYKKIAIASFIVILSLAVWNMSYKTAIISLLKLTDLPLAYQERLDTMGYIYQEDFEFANPPVKVYEENKYNPLKGRSRPKPEPITIAKAFSKEKVNVSFQSRSKEELIKLILENVPQPIVQAETQQPIARAEDKETLRLSLQSKNKEELIEIALKNKPQLVAKPKKIRKGRPMVVMQSNILYRWCMWEEMIKDVFKEKKIIGFDFGKPFRSKSLQLLRFDEGWKTRVGWLEPHNGYVHILYRSGIIGLLLILTVIIIFIKMVMTFIKIRNVKGIFLTSILLYWLTVSNFMVILELPHFAIPFWSLFGMTLRYCTIQMTQRLKMVDRER